MPNSTKKNVLFLFGAGASIRTGCPSTSQITEHIRNTITNDPFIIPNKDWALSIWQIIEHICRGFIPENEFNQLPENIRKGIAHTRPNFEHFATAIDAVKEYSLLSIPPVSSFSTLSNPLDILGEGHPSYVGARDFLINRLVGEMRFSEAIWQTLLTISPTITRNIHTMKNFIAIRIRELFPRNYDLSGFDDFVECLRCDLFDISLATTNYDLSIDHLLTNSNIEYVDGFSKINSDIYGWSGFHNEEHLKYLKLHGSANWYRIPNDWFLMKPACFSKTQIYKYLGEDAHSLIRPDLIERDKNTNSMEFGAPHMVIGGFKDRKFLDLPFTEIGLEFMSTIKKAHTIVVIGHSGGDTHLMKQFMGLISTNKRLEKIIILDTNPKRLKRWIYIFQEDRKILIASLYKAHGIQIS